MKAGKLTGDERIWDGRMFVIRFQNMSHAAYPDPAPDSFTWAHFRWFFPHFLSQVSWCLSVILGIWLFAVPSLIGHGWETVSKPIRLSSCSISCHFARSFSSS